MNKRIISGIFLITTICLLFQSPLNAQYTIGKHYAGPAIGLSFLGSALQLSGNYEYAINVENFGNVGIGGVLRYWGYNENFFGGKWSYTSIFIGAQGNYHFEIKGNNQLDPYAGIVLGYEGGSVSGPSGIFSTPSHGGLWLGFQGGMRYWIKPDLAITGRVGFGTLSYGALEFGVDWKF
jgi:hypothetical protein